MEPVYTPKLTVSFAVDLEVEYDPFKGRTHEQVAAALQETLDNLLFETSPKVVGVFTSITAIESNDWRSTQKTQYDRCFWYPLA